MSGATEAPNVSPIYTGNARRYTRGNISRKRTSFRFGETYAETCGNVPAAPIRARFTLMGETLRLGHNEA